MSKSDLIKQLSERNANDSRNTQTLRDLIRNIATNAQQPPSKTDKHDDTAKGEKQ